MLLIQALLTDIKELSTGLLIHEDLKSADYLEKYDRLKRLINAVPHKDEKFQMILDIVSPMSIVDRIGRGYEDMNRATIIEDNINKFLESKVKAEEKLKTLREGTVLPDFTPRLGQRSMERRPGR